MQGSADLRRSDGDPSSTGSGRPRLAGPPIVTIRGERIAVFRARIGWPSEGGPRLVAGESVVVAITRRNHKPLLIELGPTAALQLAAAVLAATPHED
jgi:hypothetical protein